jgi:tetratricopeptide (TPR) repeat protein
MRIDPQQVAESRRRIAATKSWPDSLLTSPGGLEMLFVCGDAELREWARSAPPNTDEHPIIEYSAPKSFLQHRQEENVQPMQDLLASFRPRRWCYPQTPSPEVPIDDAFRAADLIHDAMSASARNDFQSESRILLDVSQYAGRFPAVAAQLTQAAARYQLRHMDERGEQLLAAVVEHEGAPADALVAMAAIRRRAGDDADAITLLERAVDAAPQATAVRKQLVDVLVEREQFDRAGDHLLKLLELAPNDPYLRLDLARAFDRQGDAESARAQVDEFRDRWDGTNGPAVWRYLRNVGLGKYVDAEGPTADAPGETP